MFKWRPHPFPRGDNYKIAKIKKSSSPEPLCQLQPNLAKGISGWKGFKFVQMERQNLFTTGANYKIGKIHSRHLRILILLLNNWANFIIYIHLYIYSLKCIHWFELVSQVSDVGNGPLVIYQVILILLRFGNIWSILLYVNA